MRLDLNWHRLGILHFCVGMFLLLLCGPRAHAQGWDWARYANSAAVDRGTSVATDRTTGEVYVAGSSFGSLSELGLLNLGAVDGFLAKFKPNGTLIWAFPIASASAEEAFAIEVDDATHNVFLTGYVTGSITVNGRGGPPFSATSTGGQDMVVMSFDSSGSMIWGMVEGGVNDDQGLAITEDRSFIYIVGSYSGSAGFNGATPGPPTTITSTGLLDWFVVKYSKANGNLIWVQSNLLGLGIQKGQGIACDSNSVYICGNFDSPLIRASGTSGNVDITKSVGTGSDIFIYAFRRTDGQARWGYAAGAPNISDDAFSITSSGPNLYVGGRVGGPMTFPPLASAGVGSLMDAFLSKHDASNGNALWVDVMGNIGGNTIESVIDVGVDELGNPWACGFFNVGINFPNNSAPTTTLAASGVSDLFLANFNQAGGLIAVSQAGGAGGDGTRSLAVVNHDNVYVTGAYTVAPSIFNTSPAITSLPFEGNEDALLAKYSTCSQHPDLSLVVLPSEDTVCSGQSGSVSVFSSVAGTTYQLIDSTTNTPIGATQVGNGGTLTFPLTNLTTTRVYAIRAYVVNPACLEVLTMTAKIVVLPSPTVNLGIDRTICRGNSFTFNAGAGFSTYAWSTGASTQSIVATANGSYRVTVTNSVGCTDADTVVLNWFPTPVINLGSDINQCGGFGPILNAGPGFSSYIWSTFQPSQSITATSSGTYSVTGTDVNGCTDRDTIVVSLHPLPTVNLGPDTAYCAGTAFSLNAGAGFSSYAWNTGATTQTLTPSMSGTYSVTVVDAFGCQNSDAANVTIKPLPTAALGPDITICAPNSTTLSITGVGTSLWSTGATTNSISVSTSGTYSVTVTAGNGCTASDQINVTVTPQPAPNLGIDTNICAGSALSLFPGIFATYNWSTGATSATINVATAGTYTVTVTEPGGCAGQDQVVIGINPNPTAGAFADTSICPGATYTATAVGGMAGYAWNSGQNTQSITVSTPALYKVTVTDANGCMGMASFTLGLHAQPVVSVGPDISACTSQSGTATASPGFSSYLWSNTLTTSSISLPSPGSYSVTATDANGCQDSDTLVFSWLALPSVSLGSDTGYCPGSSLLLDAGPGQSAYAWSTGASTQTLTVSSPATYTVTVTGSNGCTNSDAVTISAYTNPSVSLGPDTTICQNASLTLNPGLGQVSYLWSTGATTSSITASTAGSYWVDVTNATQCHDRDTMVLTVAALPVVNLGPDTTLCITSSLVIDAGAGFASYVWGSGATTQSIVATPTATQTYHVTVTNAAGCAQNDQVTVTMLSLPSVNLGADTAICDEDTLLLNAGAGMASYQWSDGASSQLHAAFVSGNYAVTITDGNGCQDRDTLSLNVMPLPTVNIGNDRTICVGDSITLDPGPVGNGYLWSHGPTAQAVLVSQPGTYSVKVTAANGCVDADTMVLDNFQPLVWSIPAAARLCLGDTLTLDPGVYAVTYSWSTGENTDTLAVTAGGVYGLTLVDDNGCRTADSTVVTANALPIVALGNDTTICPVALPYNLSAGSGWVSQLWSTGDTTAAIQLTQSSAVQVAVTDANGCVGTDAFALTVAIPPSVTLGNDTSFCENLSLDLSITNTQVAILWSTGQSTNTITVSSGGTYSVDVTDALGCRDADTVNVTMLPEPTPYLGVDTTFCEGEAFLLQANAAGEYQWSTGDTTAYITVFAPGLVVVSVTANGCLGLDSINLQQTPLPVFSLGNDTTICPGDSLQLGTSITGIYQWSTGSSSSSVQVSSAGIYWLQLIDTNGCVAGDTMALHLMPVISPTITNLQPWYCLTDAAQLLSAQPVGGTFSGGATSTGLWDPLAAGVGPAAVTYTYLDNAGCAWPTTSTTVVMAPPSAAQAGPDQVVNTQATMQATAPAVGTGHWATAGPPLSVSDVFDPQAVVTSDSAGTYWLLWIVENAPCSPTVDTLLLRIEGLLVPTGFSPNDDGTNDFFVVRGIEAYPDARLSIFNRWGNLVWRSESYHNEWNGGNADGQPLADDTYYIVLEYGGRAVNSFVLLKRSAD